MVERIRVRLESFARSSRSVVKTQAYMYSFAHLCTHPGLFFSLATQRNRVSNSFIRLYSFVHSFTHSLIHLLLTCLVICSVSAVEQQSDIKP